eukprot:820780-Prorocentrum_lima.AAC.1
MWSESWQNVCTHSFAGPWFKKRRSTICTQMAGTSFNRWYKPHRSPASGSQWTATPDAPTLPMPP